MPARRTRTETREPDNLGALIQANQAWVWRYLRFLGCDPSLADDLCQETFVTVLGRSQEIDPRALRSYLRRVAFSLLAKLRRRLRRQEELVDTTIADVAFDLFCAADDGSAYLTDLRACLAGLDRRGRQVLQWRYAEGMPRKEIARRLELSEGGAKSLLARTHARLRVCISRRMAR